MTAKAVSDLTAYRPFPTDGGCKWFGTAPLCNHHCPPEYDYIRSSNEVIRLNVHGADDGWVRFQHTIFTAGTIIMVTVAHWIAPSTLSLIRFY
ncbi:unnamed protein product [Gongylonema pulchrum]|uniref:Uncharacterized protein n=1 Tax=Gongylonema pulchrum TaxID=637853 RepID=A0A183E9Z9_9BILA|nr:unnamed protein product [Gongylonema pulchrum]